MRVLLTSRYGARAASSRLRSLQFLEPLARRGIEVEPRPLFDAAYVERVNRGRGRDWPGIARAYGSRLLELARASRYDLVWVEKELLPGLPALAERALARSGVPYLADYDDAVHHRYEQGGWFARTFLRGKIDAVMRAAALVTVGSEYLAEHARAAGAAPVELLPTVVDLDRYAVRRPSSGGAFTVGWMGSPRNSAYLESVRAPLERLAARVELRILLVGSDARALEGLPVERRPWSLDREAADVREFDVGIMPLPDAPFERGKCGYKLIQYMASGVPVVASPVGANVSIVEGSGAGFLADAEEEWSEAFEALLADPAARTALGRRGRAAVERRYSTEAVVPLLERCLRRAAGRE